MSDTTPAPRWGPSPAPDTVNLRSAPTGSPRSSSTAPQALNAWNQQFGLDLLAALRRVGEEDAVRAVVLTGAGRAFSSGADLKDFGGEITPEGRPDIYKTLTERYHPIMHAIRELPLPVLACVNGPAVGIGCSLALCCDLVLAAQSAYFLLAFVNIGLVPDGGSSLFVPTRVGHGARHRDGDARRARLRRAGAGVGARSTASLPDERAARGGRRARRDASRPGPPAPTPAPSASSTAGSTRAWTSSSSSRRKLQQEMAGSEDFVEGATAFVQKRAARFSGQ